MAKLRKMYIDMDQEVIKDFMDLIESNHKKTLASWGLSYVRNQYLPIYHQLAGHDLDAYFPFIEDWINNNKKYDLKELRKNAGKIKDHNTLITYRSIITAFAIMSTPTNTLGFLLYGCMAYSYYTLGPDHLQEEYDILALQELQNAYLSLKEACK